MKNPRKKNEEKEEGKVKESRMWENGENAICKCKRKLGVGHGAKGNEKNSVTETR